MRKSFLLASTIVLAFGMAVVSVVTPAVSSAECDGGRSWDPVARLCNPPPPVPEWYRPAPTYTEPWAPPWAPPPPPAPPWAELLQLKPVWDPRLEEWTWIYVR